MQQTSNDGIVNSTDASEVQLHQPATPSNFRGDVKPDEVINNHDVDMVRLRSGIGL